MSFAMLARKHDAREAKPAATTAPGLRIGSPSGTLEREADRAADAVVSGGSARGYSFEKIQIGHVQRQPAADASAATPAPANQPAPQPNNYGEAAGKFAEAMLKTDVGKKLLDAAKNDPLAKDAEAFWNTLAGKVVTGAAAAGAVSALAATHTPLPAQIPEIPLDIVRPGLKVKLTYEGPVNRPTKAMITFSYTPQGDKKSSPQVEAKNYRAETARIAADLDKFRAGMTYKPGSAEAKQQEADKKMWDSYMTRKLGAIAGLGDRSWAPASATTPAPKSGGAGQSSDSDREQKPAVMQRKAAGAVDAGPAPAIVDQVLRSSGRPLEKATRDYFEPRFGCDFSKVRVHTGAQAAESARAVHAHAYTVGNNIAFASGLYAPESSQGRRLLAHELAHTVQQASINTSSHERPALGALGDTHEQAAERIGNEVHGGRFVTVPSRLGRLSRARLQRNPVPISADQDLSAITARLEEIIRSGGEVPTETRVICAVIVDVEGYKGAKEIRTISGSATDVIGQGAPVEHAHSPAPGTRTLTATRTISGAGSRREFPFSHINDAEIKAFESIAKNIPKDAKGSVHFLTLRVRQVKGQTVFEPIPACSGCTEATFEMGNFKNVTMISHAATHPTGSLDLGGGGSGSGPGSGGPTSTPGNEEGGTGGATKSGGGSKGASPSFSFTLAEGMEVKPATPAELLARQKVITQFESEAMESVKLSTRLQAYGAVFGGLMQILSAVSTVQDALQFAAHQTKFPAEQAAVDKLARQSESDLNSATAITDKISLLSAIAAVGDACMRGDSDALFELSDSLDTVGNPLREAADSTAEKADQLDKRAQAIAVLIDYFEKMMKLPVDPLAGTLPQSQAFMIYQSLQMFHGPLMRSAQNYRDAANLLDYYASYILGLSHAANTSAWKLSLGRAIRAAEAERQKKKPKPRATPPPAQQQRPATPQTLLPGPGPVEDSKPVELLPGAPGPSPIREAETVVGNLKAMAQKLVKQGEQLASKTPTASQEEVDAFARDVAEWRNAANIAFKHYSEHGPGVGRSGMDEALNSDAYGGRLKQLLQTFGK